MKVHLQYGKNGLDVEIPSTNVTVIKQPPQTPLADPEADFFAAIRRPINAQPLTEIVSANDRIAVVIPDITRPFPGQPVLTWLFQELSYIDPENITIINGLGSHRPNTDAELISMVGSDIFTRYRVINHDPTTPDALVEVGKAQAGYPVLLNKTYVEADKRIVLGFIEPHLMAGFSGGCKGVFPGIASLESICQYHRPSVMADPNSRYGNLLDNPTQQQVQHNGSLIPIDFLINLTLTPDHRITAFFSGDCMEAHLQGCQFVKQACMVPCPHNYPIVVTTNGGYPQDYNLYQSAKGMFAAMNIVKQDGLIISAARCDDGFGNDKFMQILFDHESPQALLATLMNRQEIECGQWMSQHFADVHLKARVALFSELNDQDVRRAHMEPVSDITRRIRQELEIVGTDASIAVLPEGFAAIPYLKE